MTPKRLCLVLSLVVVSAFLLTGCGLLANPDGYSTAAPTGQAAPATGTQAPAAAVYLVPANGGQLSADDLQKHPEVKVVHTSDDLKQAAQGWVSIWIDKDAVALVDQHWLQTVSLQRYPTVLVGYGVSLYAFRDVMQISGMSGPVIDWSKQKVGPGFSIWISGTEQQRKQGKLGHDAGYMEQPTVQAIRDAIKSLWQQTAFEPPLQTPLPPGAMPSGSDLPVAISLAFAGPIRVNQPTTLTVTITARQQTADLIGGVILTTAGSEELQVITTTIPALAANEQREWSPILQLPATAGLYQVGAAFTDSKTAATYNQGFYFAINQGTVVPNPTMRPQNAPPTIEFLGTPRATRTPLLDAKQAEVLTEQAGARPHGTPPPPSTPKPIPTPRGSVFPEPTGFVPYPQSTPAGVGAIGLIPAPFPGSLYHFENAWYEDMDGAHRRIYVWAGALAGQGGQYTNEGILVLNTVQISVQDGHRVVSDREIRSYRTPSQIGSVHVVGAVGERLILQTTNGTTLYFDVPSRQYVSSLNVTVTPPTTGPATGTPPAP